MDRASYLDSLRSDAADLLAAADVHSLGADVPSCPGWTLERLVGHVGRVYRRTAGWVVGEGSRELPRPPEGGAVVDWTRAGLAELLAAFDEVAGVGDPDTPDATVETWAGDQPPIFWPRRMAIETAVHRWDAQAAARGEGGPIGTDLALDAVDELLLVILPWRGTGGLEDESEGKTLHLHATDVAGAEAGDGEWLVTIGPGGLAVEHAHAKGDVAVRGTASDLLLLLYSRVPADRCEVFGDDGLLDRWRAAVKV
jgi:uncharacterized protein (TIGR03083 family)